jgi:glycosylphosphatidylinositol transamidase (GPIT) subunit GPI8
LTQVKQIDNPNRAFEDAMQQLDRERRTLLHHLIAKVGQQKIADRTNVNKSTITRYKKGDRINGDFWENVEKCFGKELKEIREKEAAKLEKAKNSKSIVNDPDELYKVILDGVKTENQTLRKVLEAKMTSLSDQQAADRIVILESLARLEGKPPDALLKEADQRKREIEKAREQAGKNQPEGTGDRTAGTGDRTAGNGI